MEGNIHAGALVGAVLLGVLLPWRVGRLPGSASDLVRCLLRAALTSLIAHAVLSVLVPYCLCGPGNNPSVQLWLPVTMAGIVSAVVPAVRVRWAAVALLVLTGVVLGNHFHSLVLSPVRCEYTGEVGPLMSNSCDRPARPTRLWHTWLTGLYGLEPE
jgi:hypothetical protein